MAYRLRSERSGNSSVWVRIPPSVPYGSVAQWIVQQISTLRNEGSNPSAFTKGEGFEQSNADIRWISAATSSKTGDCHSVVESYRFHQTMEREPERFGDRLLSESYRKRYQIRVLRAPPNMRV